MKGVILGLVPQAVIVDLTHTIPPQDISAGGAVLARSVEAFPTGTIHLAVVDPGVGSSLPLLAAEAGGQRFLAPDNGLLSRLFAMWPPTRMVELTERHFWRRAVSHTFHGRDILAPVAAHGERGTDLEQFSPNRRIDSLVRLEIPAPELWDHAIHEVVDVVDHFGNLITNITPDHLPAGDLRAVVVEIAGRPIRGVQRCDSESPPGELLALQDNLSCLEIAVHGGHAATRLGVSSGCPVVARWPAN